MVARKLVLPSLPNVKNGRATDYFHIGEMSDLYDAAKALPNYYYSGGSWTGHMSLDEARQCVDTGHLPSVAPSDAFLSAMEEILPAPTARHAIIDDVVGAFPNVPAMLAGQPLAMRRKVKRENEFAPIALVVNMVLSGGITGEQMEKRGAAILALARALSARRPVELWVCCGLGCNSDDASWQLYRVETAPLDLARAAFLMGHQAATRGLMYGLSKHLHMGNGHWVYSGSNNYVDKEPAIIKRALPHVSEMIYVPGAHIYDPTISDPLKWVSEKVRAYGVQDEGEVA